MVWIAVSSAGLIPCVGRRLEVSHVVLRAMPAPPSRSLNSVPNPRVKDILGVRSSPSPDALTIGRLARAAGVGVETVRYYQERQLLPVPPSTGAFRYYPVALVERIRFIKRAQELGFSLDEISDLLQLEGGADRSSIRRIATDRLGQIEQKLSDLRRMQGVLKHLVAECEHTSSDLPCPIIGTLAKSR
jgi:MerR family mercuric resistance operon transcriptional regulator